MSFACDICNEELPTEHGVKVHKGKMHNSERPKFPKEKRGPAVRGEDGRFHRAPDPPAEADGIEGSSPYAPDTEPLSTAEVAPKEPTPWRERLWGNGEKKSPGPRQTAAERKPRTRRVSTEAIWTTAWTGAGVALCRSGADIPVGNCLQFQAPIVGDILDEAVAGTVLDKVLQPIAGGGERLKKVSSVLAMPVLVAVLERNPGMAPVLEPVLRQTIREHLVNMAPVIKARQKAEENYRKALTELGMDSGDDPVEAVISAIFPPTPPNPEQNGNAANTYAAAS